jgi:predicted permease
MTKLIFTLGVITLGLGFGYSLQRLAGSGRIGLPMTVGDLRRLLQKVGLLGCMYVSFTLAVWIIRVDTLRLAALPLLGILVLVLGGLLALGAARVLRLDRKQTGSLFACGSFSNIGSIGALVVFVFLGEGGFALVPLYKLFEEVAYFTVGFPITRYYSSASDAAPGENFTVRLKKVFGDVFVIGAIAAILVGGALNLAGVPRPAFCQSINSVIIPSGTFILLTSIGLAMRFSSARYYVRECLAVIGIKFVLLPATACLIGYQLGFAAMEGGLPLKVTLILSAMPVAFTALIPPSIYDLDLELSNACWLTSTLALIPVLPVVYLILQRF